MPSPLSKLATFFAALWLGMGSALAEGELADSRGRFAQQQYYAGMPFPLSSTGRFEVAASGELLWQTEHPVQSTLRANRSGELSIDGRAIAEQRGAIVSRLLLAVLANDEQTLARYFEIARDLDEIQLTPNSDAMASVMQSIRARVDEAQRPQQLELQFSNGDRRDIQLEYTEIEK